MVHAYPATSSSTDRLCQVEMFIFDMFFKNKHKNVCRKTIWIKQKATPIDIRRINYLQYGQRIKYHIVLRRNKILFQTKHGHIAIDVLRKISQRRAIYSALLLLDEIQMIDTTNCYNMHRVTFEGRSYLRGRVKPLSAGYTGEFIMLCWIFSHRECFNKVFFKSKYLHRKKHTHTHKSKKTSHELELIIIHITEHSLISTTYKELFTNQ